MKHYLLQIQTKDAGLMLRTEVSDDNVGGLQVRAARMVSANPIVKGMTYRIFEITKKVAGGFHSVMVKQAQVAA